MVQSPFARAKALPRFIRRGSPEARLRRARSKTADRQILGPKRRDRPGKKSVMRSIHFRPAVPMPLTSNPKPETDLRVGRSGIPLPRPVRSLYPYASRTGMARRLAFPWFPRAGRVESRTLGREPVRVAPAGLLPPSPSRSKPDGGSRTVRCRVGNSFLVRRGRFVECAASERRCVPTVRPAAPALGFHQAPSGFHRSRSTITPTGLTADPTPHSEHTCDDVYGWFSDFISFP